MQLHSVEFATSAQVDVDPLLTHPCALPRAGEAVGASNLNALFAAEEGDLAKLPHHKEATHRTSSGDFRSTLHAIDAVAPHGSEGNGGKEELARLGESSWISVGGRRLRRGGFACLSPGASIGRNRHSEIGRAHD